MISISTSTVDNAGTIVFSESPETLLREPAARVTRKKTLDGGVYIDHSGVVDGDRTFTLSIASITDSQHTTIVYLQRNYTSVRVSCRKGVFKGTIEKIRMVDGRADITILVEEKLTS